MTIGELLAQFGNKYLVAMLTTWKLTAVSFAFALLIGVAVTVMRTCPVRPLRMLGDFYVQVFRNIPGAALPYGNCVVIATTLIPSAFCSEYLMSGINTIGIGQIEAARSLGMTFGTMMRRIVIPQAVRSSVLPMTNLLIATMLTTSLGSQVPLNPQELTGLVSYINTHAVGGVTAFLISALLYCATAVVIGQIGSAIDRRVRIIR